MRTLITGINGFVGRHLTTFLQRERPQHHLFGSAIESGLPPGVNGWELDLCEAESTRKLIQAVKPGVIFHLAAQTFVPRSFENPWETLQNNILAQLNVLEACLSVGIKPRIIVISSGEIYGAVAPDELPISENAALRPNSPYSVSKVTQDLLAYQYCISHGLPILRARPFNHFGPGQSKRFMTPDFAMQVARMEKGAEPILQVGNLETRRDFTDVRDIVRAYVALAEQGEAGAAYNIASGVSHSAGDVVAVLEELTPIRFRVAVQQERLRPSDSPDIIGDASRLRAATGWQPQIPFRQTLKDILENCRQELALNPASV